MLILGIETSCDETAAAVLAGAGDLRASVVHSQASLHAVYGGVVPEVASRNHLVHTREVVEAALALEAFMRAPDTDPDGEPADWAPGLDAVGEFYAAVDAYREATK
jgi:N6-L-threonylcarbamoyladenine synthase